MGKPCPGGTAPSVQVNALCCSTAAAAELLTPPTRPLSPGQGDRVASPFWLSALLGAGRCDPRGPRPGV